jgi:protein TonB
MRFFVAFFISLLIYIALIWFFITNFSEIKVILKKRNEHIIKIDIRDIITPKKVSELEALAPKETRLKPSIPNLIKPEVKKVVKKKIIKKKSIKKRVVKKKITKKKPVKKRVVKKKITKKKPVKKKVVKKKIVKKIVKEEQVVIDNSFLMESFEVIEPIADDLSTFLSAPTVSTTTKSYPNRKIKKLYGSSFHTFTPTQKSFIEDNLNTIQGITQRILTQRGYPQGAGRTQQEGTNVVSFKLHPNGTISHLRLKTRIGYRALDDNTLSLIRTAYREYPYPSTTTQIIFYVTYSIY